MKAVVLALLVASSASAQTLEARRYRTAEGVEVLTSRAAPTPAPVASAPAVHAPGPASPANSHRVPPETQTGRDKERFSILNAELITEAKVLSTKRQALASPRASQDLSTEELQSLRASIAVHEDNIRAIDREIRRLPASLATGSVAARLPGGLSQ